MACKPGALTVERIREILDYDPKTGFLTWRLRIGDTKGIEIFNRLYAGKRAGSLQKNGYRLLSIDNRNHWEHRVIWAHVHGEFPRHEVDHESGAADHNSVSNFRAATHAENMQNMKMPRTNTSGFLGVSKLRNKWRAQININGRNTHIGCFITKQEAHEAYLKKRAAHFSFQPVPREPVRDAS